MAIHYHTSVSDENGRTSAIVPDYATVKQFMTETPKIMKPYGYHVTKRRQNGESYRSVVMEREQGDRVVQYILQANVCDSHACPPPTHEAR